jgi:hypothetical protein
MNELKTALRDLGLKPAAQLVVVSAARAVCLGFRTPLLPRALVHAAASLVLLLWLLLLVVYVLSVLCVAILWLSFQTTLVLVIACTDLSLMPTATLLLLSTDICVSHFRPAARFLVNHVVETARETLALGGFVCVLYVSVRTRYVDHRHVDACRRMMHRTVAGLCRLAAPLAPWAAPADL